MDPRVALLERELDRFRAELRCAIDTVPAGVRGVVPGDGIWSVAMVVEHLCQTERSVTNLLGSLGCAAQWDRGGRRCLDSAGECSP